MSGRRTQAYQPMLPQPLCQLEMFDSGEKQKWRAPLAKQINTRLYCYANSFLAFCVLRNYFDTFVLTLSHLSSLAQLVLVYALLIQCIPSFSRTASAPTNFRLSFEVKPIATPCEKFIACAHDYFIEEYLPEIERCLERLTDEQIWFRANEESNSIGNLVLHLLEARDSGLYAASAELPTHAIVMQSSHNETWSRAINC